MKLECIVPGLVVAVAESFNPNWMEVGMQETDGVFIGPSMEAVAVLLRTAYQIPDGQSIKEWLVQNRITVSFFETA